MNVKENAQGQLVVNGKVVEKRLSEGSVSLQVFISGTIPPIFNDDLENIAYFYWLPEQPYFAVLAQSEDHSGVELGINSYLPLAVGTFQIPTHVQTFLSIPGVIGDDYHVTHGELHIVTLFTENGAVSMSGSVFFYLEHASDPSKTARVAGVYQFRS